MYLSLIRVYVITSLRLKYLDNLLRTPSTFIISQQNLYLIQNITFYLYLTIIFNKHLAIHLHEKTV
jgi:hypothetical protein